jgi:hypothetical protein
MKQLLYNAVAVRNELYGVWNEIQEMKNTHLVAWSRSPEGHAHPCRVCFEYECKKAGVNWAIRHFGGRPRR